jgi:hypothetical protein
LSCRAVDISHLTSLILSTQSFHLSLFAVISSTVLLTLYLSYSSVFLLCLTVYVSYLSPPCVSTHSVCHFLYAGISSTVLST